MNLIEWAKNALGRRRESPEETADPYNLRPPVRSSEDIEEQHDQQRQWLEEQRRRADSGDVDPDRFEPGP